MSTADDFTLLIDRFVEDIQALVKRAEREAVQEALAGAARASGAPAKLPVQPPKPGKRAPTRPLPRPVRALPRPARAPLPPAPSPMATAAAQAPTQSSVASERTPMPLRTAEPAATERETAVLRAVDDLVHATATEVAEHTALPNGTVSVALRALVVRGRLERLETARGVEYSVARRHAT